MQYNDPQKIVPLRQNPTSKPGQSASRDESALPSSAEIEEVILGGILIDPHAMDRVIEILPSPEPFHFGFHQEIYAAAIALHKEGRRTDLFSTAQWLADHGKLEAAGGNSALARLADNVVSALNIDYYAELIAEYWQRRSLITAAAAIRAIADNTSMPLEEVLSESEDLIFEATQMRQSGTVESLATIGCDRFTEIEQRSAGLTPPGIATGFYDLDAMTYGFQRGDLIVAAGRPAMGKTAFMLACAQGIAARGAPVFIASLEMGKKALFDRLLSAECQIESGRIKAGRIREQEWESLNNAISYLSAFQIFVDDAPVTTVSEISSKAKRIKAQTGDLGLIAIDYLQLMGGSGENRVQELSRITRALKAMARELDCPVLALSQLSRGVESRANKRPMMSDLRESGSIEQDCDLIMMLYRDEYYNPETSDRGIAEVILSKQRNGATGTIKLLFEPQFTRFRNLANPKNHA